VSFLNAKWWDSIMRWLLPLSLLFLRNREKKTRERERERERKKNLNKRKIGSPNSTRSLYQKSS
jgi:hypothetical protein